MMLDHYLQLLRRHRRLVLWIVVAVTVVTAALNTVFLVTRPVYTAAAQVLMVPTDAELAFSQGRVEAGRTAQTLTQTHIEYLKSRTLAEKVLEELRAEGLESGAEAEEEKGPLAAVGEAVTGALRAFKIGYRILNSGEFVEPDPGQQAVAALMRAIEVATVPGSYILQVRVSLKSPTMATRVANSLAGVYVERVSRDLESSAGQLESFIEEQILAKRVRLDALLAEEQALRRELGLLTVEEDREQVAEALEAEGRKLSDTQVRIEELQSELVELRREKERATSAGFFGKLEEQISLGQAELSALRAGVAERQRTIRRLTAELDQIKVQEQPLESFEQRREGLERDLADLSDRMLGVNLARSTALSQVRVIDPAIPPLYPASPRVIDNTIVAFLAGWVISALLLVAVDTFSGKVKTPAELDRLTDGDSLGELDGDLVAALASGAESPELADRLRELGRRVERRLAVHEGFDAPAVLISGFLEDERLHDVSLTLARSLAERGRQVSCWAAGSEGEPRTVPVAAEGGSLVLLAERDRSGGDTLRLERLRPVDGGFRFNEAAERSPVLVCVVPLGEVDLQEVAEFRERAHEKGISGVSFVALDG